MRLKRIFGALVSVFLTFPATIKASEADEQFLETSRQQLLMLSQYGVKQELNSGRIIEDEKATAYIKSVIGRIRPGEENKYEIVIINDHEANAWITALPRIRITNSILTLLENEAQLAYILAHEITHYELEHSLQDFTKKIEDFRNTHTLLLLDVVFSSSGRSREQELEADKLATKTLLDAGYDPEQAVRAQDLLASVFVADAHEVSRKTPSRFDALVRDALRSHPTRSERVALIRESIAAHGDPIGTRVEEGEYLDNTRQFWSDVLERCLLIRDDHRLQVYLSSPQALARYGGVYYYYASEMYRLRADAESVEKVLPLLISAISNAPDFPSSYRAIARYKLFRQGNPKSAKSYYSSFLHKSNKPADQDMLGTLLEMVNEPQPLSGKTPQQCVDDAKLFTSLDTYFEVRMPCDWYVRDKRPYRISASHDGWLLNEIFAYSIPVSGAFDSINEVVMEPADDALDIMEMSRADNFKGDSDYVKPSGTGYKDINGQRFYWYGSLYRDVDGISKRMIRYETMVSDRFIGLAYVAPEIHYYDHYLPVFISVLESLKIIGNPITVEPE